MIVESQDVSDSVVEVPTSQACQSAVERTALLVLGMHRSGTSAITRVVNLLGADLPSHLMRPKEGDNALGFWESKDAYKLNDAILDSLGSRWDDWRRLNPDWIRSPKIDAYKQQARGLLEREFADSPFYVLKDPRICRLFPFWQETYRDIGAQVKCILPLRNPMEVAASLKARNGFDPPKSCMLWLRHVLEAECATRDLQRSLLAFDELLNDWREIVARIGADLDLVWPRHSATAEVEIDQFLSESHRHHTIDQARLRSHPDIAQWVKDTTDALNELLKAPQSIEAMERLDEIRTEFNRASDALGTVLRAEEMARDDAEQIATRLKRESTETLSTLAEREKRIAALKQESASRDSRIEQLRKMIAEKDAVIAERERTINGYKSKLDEHAGQIEKLSELNGQREEQIQELKQNAAERERVIAQLKKTVNDQEKRITAAKNTADSQNGELSRLKATQVAQRTENSKLLVERNRALHRLHEVKYPRSPSSAGVSLPPRQCFGIKLSRRERFHFRKRAKYLLDHQLFDSSWYIETYPDVVFDGADPLWHWLVIGWKGGFDPNPLFDTKWYLKHNEDVAKASINPLFHYLKYGCKEGRDPSPLFDTNWYLQKYPDVAKAKVNPLIHYLKHGRSEGRAPKLASKQQSRAEDGVESLNENIRSVQKQSTSPSIRALQVTPERVAAASTVLNDRLVGSFSIILPTWNRRKTIERSIDSVLAQSFTDWELIICDDGSEDGTDVLVEKRYGPRLTSGQIRYLTLNHKGVCATRNAGLRVAKGDWIAYLDSDNAWHPDYLLITAAGYAQEPQRRTAYGGIFVQDAANDREFVRCQEFDWGRLLKQNYIDLNAFSHHRSVLNQLGGFDQTLTRLVDWDLILRYTKLYEPKFNSLLLVDYFVSHSLNNITLTQPLNSNEAAVRRKNAADVARYGATPLRIAYVLWHWPALSQAFVLEEIRELLRRCVDIRVYFAAGPDKAAENVPDVIAQYVSDADELAEMLIRDGRNWIHSHLVYPAVTKLVWPAAERTGIAFSFMPQAVDIFNDTNREHNRIGDIANSSLCARLMVHGEHPRRFLIDRGVPASKLIMTAQAVDTKPIKAEHLSARERRAGELLRVVTIGHVIKKKGIEDLVNAAALIDRGLIEVRLYGYGLFEKNYRELVQEYGLDDTFAFEGDFEGTDVLRTAKNWADVFYLPCVEAENGDVDGMPTVFFEAMAAGVPCVAGAVSTIANFITDGINGFLVRPHDPVALAKTLTRLAAMPTDALVAVGKTAQDWADEHLKSRHTVDTLLDTCASPPIDIFMVTYHRDGCGNWAATARAILSVLERTTTPFVLTVVDNGSEPESLERLRGIATGDKRVRLIELGENRLGGPASNVALDLARSEFVFYICSKNGYVAQNGWERPCLRYMRNRPRVAFAGHLVSSPAWPNGKGYMRQDWFSGFRNPEFAVRNPERPFLHVQGGVWVLRRSVYEAEGGFSQRLTQAQIAVEYSYYLESMGYELGDIPGLIVLSNKTSPGLEAFLDERVLAAHPVIDETRELIDECVRGASCRCNICGWVGEVERLADGVSFDCPECDSSPRDRAVFRWLAGSDLRHREKTLEARDLGNAVRRELEKMFRLVEVEAEVTISAKIPGAPSRMLGIPPLSVKPLDVSSASARLDGQVGARTMRLLSDEQVAQRARELTSVPQKTLVSIIMPIGNRANQISVAIESVQAQIYRTWELLVVDDGSEDDSEHVVAAYAADDQRIRYICTPRQGVAAACNAGLDAACGEVIAYLDSGNIWDRNYLLFMVDALHSSGRKTAFSAQRIHQLGVATTTSIRSNRYLRSDLLKNNYIDINVFVHTRDLVSEFGGFDPMLRCWVGYDLILRYTADHPPAEVPVVLGDCQPNAGLDQIDNEESVADKFVVLNKHLIDWNRQRERISDRKNLVSIVIPVYNQPEFTETCLASIHRHTAREKFQVILVDNGSVPEAKAVLERLERTYSEVRVVRNDDNYGFALGCNIGVAAAEGSIIVLLNNDTEVTAGWLPPLVKPVENDPSIGIVGPKLLFPDDTLQAGGIVFSNKSLIPYHLYQGFDRTDPAINKRRFYQAATGACFAVRAEDFVTLRGFDPIFLNGCEDIDFCLRLKTELGLRILYEPASEVYHHEGKTPGRGANIMYNRGILADRWGQAISADDETFYKQDGYRVLEYVKKGTEAHGATAAYYPRLEPIRGKKRPVVKSRDEEQAIKPVLISQCPRRTLNIGFSSIWYARGISFHTRQLAMALEGHGFDTHIFARWESDRFSNVGPIYHPRVTNVGDDPSPSELLDWVKTHHIDCMVFMEIHPKDWKRVEAVKEAGICVLCYENLDILRLEHFDDYGLFDCFLFNTFYTREVFRERFPRKHDLTLPWGIPPEGLAIDRPARSGGILNFCHIGGWGGVNNRKNTDLLIRAFHAVDAANIRLHLYSQVPIANYGRECAASARQDKRLVVHEGTIDNIYGAYREADMLLWPSKREGLGLPIVEALASGLPVLISDGYLMKQWPVPGTHGVLCPAQPLQGAMYLPEMDVSQDTLSELIVELADEPERIDAMRENVIRDRRIWQWTWQPETLREQLRRIIEEPGYYPAVDLSYLPEAVLSHERSRQAALTTLNG